MWQEIVKIAEGDLKIEIIKKYGDKQPTPSKNKKEKIAIEHFYGLLGYSKQAYYKCLKQMEQKQYEEIARSIKSPYW